MPFNQKYKGDLIVLGRKLRQQGVLVFTKIVELNPFADGPTPEPPSKQESDEIAMVLAFARRMDPATRPREMDRGISYPGKGKPTRWLVGRLVHDVLPDYARDCFLHELKDRLEEHED